MEQHNFKTPVSMDGLTRDERRNLPSSELGVRWLVGMEVWCEGKRECKEGPVLRFTGRPPQRTLIEERVLKGPE